ncbi:MAG: diaminopimelate decarboxylase [Cellvibrionaceae bacterium]|jgi:diaminopimelate decarboxylase
MSEFYYRDGQLICEQLPLADIAECYGTPAYVYSRAALTKHFLEYQTALGNHPGIVCYAVKANSNIAVLNILARLGAGFDIVSVGELERVLRAGGNPAKVVFSGVAKTAVEMKYALEVGIHCFNVESIRELQRLNEVASSMGVKAPVSLRVNPDVDAKTHPYISTGLKENKFGVDIEDAISVYQYAQKLTNIRIIGVDCHIGSQLTDITPFLDALDRMLQLIDCLMDLGIAIEHLDIGGGLGVSYQDEQPPAIAEYLQKIKMRMGDRPLSLLLEPGRSIAANAGVLITRVEYLKTTPHKNFAIIDAGMNDNIRPALYQAWQKVLPLKKIAATSVLTWDLVGPVCETGDFLAKDRELALEDGDLLALMSAGAYGFSMSSNYNSRVRPVELMVDGERLHLIRQRETVAQLMQGEQLIPSD